LHRPVPSAEGSIGELTPGFSSSSQLTPQFLSTAQEQRIKANASNSGPVQSGPSKLAVESDELMAVLQKRVTELQKQNLALESQVRSAEENKKRLEQALKEKVELQVLTQQQRMEIDEYKYRSAKKEKELQQKASSDKAKATASLESEKLHLEAESRRLKDRLEQEIEEKMSIKTQFDLKSEALNELQTTLRVVRAEKAKVEVQVVDIESFKNTILEQCFEIGPECDGRNQECPVHRHGPEDALGASTPRNLQ